MTSRQGSLKQGKNAEREVLPDFTTSKFKMSMEQKVLINNIRRQATDQEMSISAYK